MEECFQDIDYKREGVTTQKQDDHHYESDGTFGGTFATGIAAFALSVYDKCIENAQKKKGKKR